MTFYERIFDEAIGNYGLVTSAEAKRIGVPPIELVKLAQRGKLRRLGYGVYKLTQYAPAAAGLDAYADALALVGAGSYLYGASVLAVHGLCPTNPARIHVATPNRCRRHPGGGIEIKERTPCDETDWHEGLPLQPVPQAILAARGTVMDERLKEAVSVARQKGLVDGRQARALRRMLDGQAA